jgi:hypothetical protein
LRDAAAAVGDALGGELAPRDSSYYCGDYFRANQSGCTVLVLQDCLEDDGEPLRPELPEGAIFVEIQGPTEADERSVGQRLVSVRDLVPVRP